ncbi:MAG: RNA 2',3'-cyclic phosphodiesterase [Gemmatimonadota bacterium]
MRLFVAINFPKRLRERIARLARPLQEAEFPVRWVEPDKIHLTLKFIGEVRTDRAEEFAEALCRTAGAFRPFELRFERIGAFPSPRHPRVIWLGVEPTPELRFLKHDIEQALGEMGVPRERRLFQPHITLGRASGRHLPGSFQGLEAISQEARLPAGHRVSHIDLMRSRLGPKGATYTLLKAAPLGA